MKNLFLLLVLCLVMAGFTPPRTETVRIKTSAICEMCKERIEKSLLLLRGVKDADLNLDDKTVTVSYLPKKVSVEEIREKIRQTGYDADGSPADQKAHDRLPACCRKGAADHH